MPAQTTHADQTDRSGARRWEINPTMIAIAVAVVALIVSLLILQGQTTARIDDTREGLGGDITVARMELTGTIDATRTELAAAIEATRTELRATNDRIDRVLEVLAGIGTVADDIAALRADVKTLADR